MEYTPLEPKNLSSLGISPSSFSSITPSFFATSTFIYSLFFVAIVVAAFYRYVLAGIWRMEASSNAVKKSNDELKRVTWGLLGVFSLFLILFTVNKDMLTGDVGLSKLALGGVGGETGSKSGSVGTTAKPKSGADNPSIPKNNDDPDGWNAIKNDSKVRASLKSLPNGGISVNKTVCNNPAQTSCTTVGGLPPETISMLEQLRNTCTGGIEVTGGNEAGHSSHGPGKTPVDLSKNKPGNLNECISSFTKSTRAPKNKYGNDLCYPNKVFENFGFIFCDEMGGDPHWHVYK